MIDFIKAHFKGKHIVEQHLIKQRGEYLLEGKYNYSHGEKMYPLRSKRGNMFINITEKGGYIENSLHKHFNELIGEGNHNHNDFDYCNLIVALNALEGELNYPLEDTVLTNLEFGFNIDLGKDPTHFLENNLLMYKAKSPCYNPKNNKTMKFKEFTYNEYRIKVYNKSLQYGLDKKGENILRIEIKYKSKVQLNKFGIYNLLDLKNPSFMYSLFDDFLKKFDDLLIIDSYNGNSSMTRKERLFITHCTNPNYWIDLRNNFSRNIVSIKKRKLDVLIEKHELDTWKKELKSLLVKKFSDLINTDCNDGVISFLNAA